MEDFVPSGKAQDLTTSSAQALHAIIHSISPEILGSSRNGDTLTPQQIKKLSDKLEELVGEGEPDGFTQNRHEKGEIVNEDGLPIIEITEQLVNVDSSLPNNPPASIDEPDLVPLASLSESERHRLRIERDRILNILEEEERKEHLRGEELDEEHRRELLQKRKAAAKIEVEKLKAAKMLQKKMGKALLRNMANTTEGEQNKPMQHTEKKETARVKKTVTFADDAPAKLDQSNAVAPKQGTTNRNTPLAKPRLEKCPMKMNVVERFPAKVTKTQENKVDQTNSSDSSVHTESGEGNSIPTPCEDNESPTEEQYEPDVVPRQHEIALEYYEKRRKIGKHVSRVLLPEEGDQWDQPEVPLDATLSSPPPKPAISHFKANRVVAAYNTSAPSTSLGSSVLPAASSQALQRAVRIGKLEGDQLVSVDESASENEDDSMREMLELLKRNQVQDVGLESNSRSFDKSSSSEPAEDRTITQHQPAANSNSKFKPVRSSPSSRTTTVSHVERSSPKFPSSPGVVERHMFLQSENISSSPTERVSQSRRTDPVPESKPTQLPAIDSSSRPPVKPTTHPAVIAAHPFPDASTTSRPNRPPPVMSSIVKESSRNSDKNTSQGLNSSSQRRVSRFMAQRS